MSTVIETSWIESYVREMRRNLPRNVVFTGDKAAADGTPICEFDNILRGLGLQGETLASRQALDTARAHIWKRNESQRPAEVMCHACLQFYLEIEDRFNYHPRP